MYIVFGATGAVGGALCERLNRAGATVVACGRDESRLAALRKVHDATTLSCDVTSLESVESVITQAVDAHGPPSGIANCAGSLLLKPAHLTTADEWADTLSVNLTGAFNVIRTGVRAMLSSGGSIVLVSSVAGRMGLPNHEAIAAAKAGVIGLTLASAASYASRGIRVNCVAPGLTRSIMTERIFESESSLKASVAMHPIGRPGEPEDIASAIAWLLDPENTWVTGQVIGVDGGLGSVKARARA